MAFVLALGMTRGPDALSGAYRECPEAADHCRRPSTLTPRSNHCPALSRQGEGHSLSEVRSELNAEATRRAREKRAARPAGHVTRIGNVVQVDADLEPGRNEHAGSRRIDASGGWSHHDIVLSDEAVGDMPDANREHHVATRAALLTAGAIGSPAVLRSHGMFEKSPDCVSAVAGTICQ